MADMMTTSELRELNKERQTGQPTEDNPPLKIKNHGYGSIGNAVIQELQSGNIDNGTRSYTKEAVEEGWGDSRYDKNNWYAPGMDLEQSRALQQSGFAKIGNGLIKGGITAAATAANTVLGTALGLGKFFWEYMPATVGLDPEKAPDFMESLDAAVNNNISKWTTDLQRKSEEWFPNYRTEAERSEQYQKEWYKHMGTANFIGDSFLKNFGFTVGAMGGGMVWSKILGNSMSKKLASDILKGSIIAAEGDAEANATLQRVAQAVRTGTVEAVDANKLAVSIQEAAKRINKADALLQIYGATIGAMGEGNMEGLMAKQEFLDDYLQDVNERFIQNYKDAEQEVLQEGMEKGNAWVSYVPYVDENGQVKTRPVLSQAGKMQVEERRNDLMKDLEADRQQAQVEGDRLASTTFLLNLPILTTSNLIQFGRMFSGGWKTSRANAAKVRGTLAKTAGTELDNAGYKAPSFAAEYTGAAGKIWQNSVWNALKVMGTESFEEMAQGTVSSGAKNVAQANMASFNNDGYDPNSINKVRDWFENMYEGGAEYLGDIKNWQEGALGALTGLFGIPGKVWKKGERWHGGIPGAISDAKERVSASETAAAQLNALVNSKEFQDRWHGYIRHLKYDAKMEDAINKDDPYAWHTANDAQLINDVIMFADAGKLEDLAQIVDAYGTLSDADAASIKEAMKDNDDAVTNPGRDLRNMNPADIVSRVREQANNIKDTISQYKNIYDALSTRAPADASPELLKELVFTTMLIKKHEERFMKMLNETLVAIEPVLNIQKQFRRNGEVIENANEQQERLAELKSLYESIFGKVNLPVQIPKYIEEATEKTLDVLEEYADGIGDAKQKVQDMRKLSKERKEYYRKLVALQGEAAQRKFNEQAVTQGQVEQEALDQMVDIELDGLDTPEAVKQAYLSKNAKERIDFAKTLASAESKNPAVKRFMDMKRRHDGFRAYTEKNGFDVDNVAVTPTMLFSAVNDLLRYSNSEQELMNMPDNVFMSLDEFKRTFSGLIPVSDGVYDSMRQAMRNTMQKYLESEGLTSSRNNLSRNPVQTSTQGTSTPTGQDAAQPGSVAPAPTPAAAPVPVQQPAPQPAAPVSARTTGEEVAFAEQQGFTRVAENPSADELVEEAHQTEGSVDIPGEAKLVDGKIPYYRTSVPEISTKEAEKARKGGDDRKSANLADFPTLEEGKPYEEIWNALKDAGAFETVAERLQVGDEIEFVVDPAFPKYEGQYQILVCTTKDGQRKVLTVLSGQNSKYFGLAKLRGEIDSEYRKFIDAHPNETFVFSKKSKVWAKRAGQVDYDYSQSDPFANDRNLKDIPAYDESAPIIFINRNGNAQVVRGDLNTLSKVSPNTFTSAFNSSHVGSLYYMAKNGDDSYVPIRLYVQHFRPDNMDSTNPLFLQAKSIISSIATQASGANKVGTDFEEENRKLRDKLASLVKLLDLHDLYLELGNYTNIGPALKMVTWEKQEDGTRKEEHAFRTADQITPDWLIGKVAELEASFQIRQKEEGGTLDQLEEFIDNGIITSNAKMLRAKGVDFYFNAWDDESQSFKPMVAEQVSALESAEVSSEPEVSPGLPPIPAGLEGAVLRRSNRDDDDWFGEDAAPIPDKVSVSPQLPIQESAPANPASRVWSELSADEMAGLSQLGWSEEEFNDSSPDEQDKALRCIGS